MYIIDCHSHFGNDYYKGNITIDDYLHHISNMGVNLSLLMPVPSPKAENNEKILKVKYIKNKGFLYSPNVNPFINMNYKYYDKLIKYKNTSDKKLIYVPYIHPILDKVNKLEELINYIHPAFFKINGVQSCVNPKNVPKEFINLLKKYNIALIIHTQYQNQYIDSFDGNRIIKKINHPYQWAKFLINNEISGILNHGCGLDIDTLNLIKDYKNILVALGPDLALLKNNNRVSINLDKNNQLAYLYNLKKLISYKKIVFDIDYNWNIIENKDYLDDVERVKKVFSQFECEYIFNKNILSISKTLQKEL